MISLVLTTLLALQSDTTTLNLKSWDCQVTSSGKVRSLRWVDANGGRLDIFVPSSGPGDRRALVNFGLAMDSATQGNAEYWIDGKKFASRYAAKHDTKDQIAIKNDPGTGYFKVNAVDLAKNTVDVEFRVELTEFNPHYSKQGKGRTFTFSWRLNGLRSSSLSGSSGGSASSNSGTSTSTQQPSAASSNPNLQVPRVTGGTNPTPDRKPPVTPPGNQGGAANTPGTNPPMPPTGPDQERRRAEAKQQVEQSLAELERKVKSFENAVGTIVGIAHLRAQRNEVTREFRRQLDEIPSSLPPAHRAALGRVIAAQRDYTIALAEQSFAESELRKAQDELNALPANDGRRLYFQGVVSQRQVDLTYKQREVRDARDGIPSAQAELTRTLDALASYVSPRDSMIVDPAGGKVLEQLPLEVDEVREFLRSLWIAGSGANYTELEFAPYSSAVRDLDGPQGVSSYDIQRLVSHYPGGDDNLLRVSFRKGGNRMRLSLRRTAMSKNDLPGQTLEGNLEITFSPSQVKWITSDVNSRYPKAGTLTVFLESAKGEAPITIAGSRSDAKFTGTRRVRGGGLLSVHELKEEVLPPLSVASLQIVFEVSSEEAATLATPFSGEFTGPLVNRVGALLATLVADGTESTLEQPMPSLRLTKKPEGIGANTEYSVAFPFQGLVPQYLLSDFEARRAFSLGDTRAAQGELGLAMLLYAEGARMHPDLASPRMFAVVSGYREIYEPSRSAKESGDLLGKVMQNATWRRVSSVDPRAGGIYVAHDWNDIETSPDAVMHGGLEGSNPQKPLTIKRFHELQSAEAWTVKEYVWVTDRMRKASEGLVKVLSPSGGDPAQALAETYDNPEAAGCLAFMHGWDLWEGGQFEKAVAAFDFALDVGFHAALSPLGLAAMQGKGVPKNEALAVSLWTKGAELGIRDCQRLLGVTKALGTKDSPPNAEEAKVLWTEASRPGLCLFGRMLDKQAKAFLEGSTPNYELLRLPHFLLGEAPVHHSQMEKLASVTPATLKDAPVTAATPTPEASIPTLPIGEYKMVDLGGRNITHEIFKERAVVMYFFATWCHPSKECAKAIEQLSREFGGGKLSVIAANVFEHMGQKKSEKDKREISRKNTLKFREQISANPMHIFTTFNDELAERWKIKAVPTILLIDRGNLVQRWEGLGPKGIEEIRARAMQLIR